MPAPTYFKVTHKDGSYGVTIGDLFKFTPWKNLISQAQAGTVYVDVYADSELTAIYYSESHDYMGRDQLKDILRSMKSKIIVRYGISKIDGMTALHLDVLH